MYFYFRMSAFNEHTRNTKLCLKNRGSLETRDLRLYPLDRDELNRFGFLGIYGPTSDWNDARREGKHPAIYCVFVIRSFQILHTKQSTKC